MPIVVMGVAGTGKTTVGSLLGAALNLPFTDGDALHSAESIAKMSAGVALTDEDRRPWLWRVGLELRRRGGVIACSALRRSYRDVIRAVGPDTQFVHLVGDAATIEARLSARSGHFMSSRMLSDQLALLEPLEADEVGLEADITSTPNAIVASAVKRLQLEFAPRSDEVTVLRP